jgi:beta-mannosidase
MHYWGVWHSQEQYERYADNISRFMSEYGFQSFPQIETVQAYARSDEHHIQSPVMMAHQRHPRGNQLIKEYMLREYPEPKNFESFLYVSQVLQAEGIKVGAEHLRRIMPRNMGSLYWQLDDCWPVASWSSIDYFGRWKALQYYAKRFYAPVLVTPQLEGDDLKFYIVSDLNEPTKGVLNIELRDLDGNKVMGIHKDVTAAPVRSQSYFSQSLKTLLAARDPKSVFIYCELLVNGKAVSSNSYYFAPYKELSLPTPQISFDVVRVRNGYKVMLTTDKLSKSVYLSTRSEGFFADNYFDLYPDKPLEVEFRTKANIPVEEFRNQLTIRSLKDAFSADGATSTN